MSQGWGLGERGRGKDSDLLLENSINYKQSINYKLLGGQLSNSSRTELAKSEWSQPVGSSVGWEGMEPLQNGEKTPPSLPCICPSPRVLPLGRGTFEGTLCPWALGQEVL